jgi:acyl-CoA synthetase (NDP forming)
MAHRVQKSFFLAKEVLFIGYSKRQAAFCKSVKEAFERSGAKVYPVNPTGGSEGLQVYASIEAVPARPELAYVLTNKANTAKLIDSLASRGVKRVLFQSKMSVDEAALDRCAKLGMETAVACPLMALGGGFHKFHGFLHGVRSDAGVRA